MSATVITSSSSFSIHEHCHYCPAHYVTACSSAPSVCYVLQLSTLPSPSTYPSGSQILRPFNSWSGFLLVLGSLELSGTSSPIRMIPLFGTIEPTLSSPPAGGAPNACTSAVRCMCHHEHHTALKAKHGSTGDRQLPAGCVDTDAPWHGEWLRLQCRAASRARRTSPSRHLPLASGPVKQPQFLRIGAARPFPSRQTLCPKMQKIQSDHPTTRYRCQAGNAPAVAARVQPCRTCWPSTARPSASRPGQLASMVACFHRCRQTKRSRSIMPNTRNASLQHESEEHTCAINMTLMHELCADSPSADLLACCCSGRRLSHSPAGSARQ